MSPGQTVQDYTPDGKGNYMGFRMRADEVLIMVGKTPPPMKFFNFPLFIDSRQASLYSTKSTQGKVVPLVAGTGDQARMVLFGGLGDTINIESISTLGTTDGKNDPYNQPYVIIVTPDQTTDYNVRTAALSAGYPEVILTTEVVPSSVVKLGTDQNADAIGFGTRNAMFIDQQACQAYINNPGVRVFRHTWSPARR